MARQQSLFDNGRTTLKQALDFTRESLSLYGAQYAHWAIAYSGGKDSSALVSAVIHLLHTGQLERPDSLTVLYSDTRQELPPLHIGALETLATVRRMGYAAQVVLPALDDRYFVYMLGRGVPPPNNNTLRWCTPQLKVEPMLTALKSLRDTHGEKVLMLTGVRIGESAARDARIAVSCGRNGAECGQGWFQETTPDSIADTLAPLLHWRVCHVWDWLTFNAHTIMPSVSFVAEVYGGEEAEEISARTGCIGCPLATKDTALDHILTVPEWAYLQPLKRLRPLYIRLRRHQFRKQKDGERNTDGSLSKNPSRKGPLTLEARERALQEVLAVQGEVNAAARASDRPMIDLINAEEEARIRQLIAARTYPNKWGDGDPDAITIISQTYSDGSVQSPLPAIWRAVEEHAEEYAHAISD